MADVDALLGDLLSSEDEPDAAPMATMGRVAPTAPPPAPPPPPPREDGPTIPPIARRPRLFDGDDSGSTSGSEGLDALLAAAGAGRTPSPVRGIRGEAEGAGVTPEASTSRDAGTPTPTPPPPPPVTTSPPTPDFTPGAADLVAGAGLAVAVDRAPLPPPLLRRRGSTPAPEPADDSAAVAADAALDAASAADAGLVGSDPPPEPAVALAALRAAAARGDLPPPRGSGAAAGMALTALGAAGALALAPLAPLADAFAAAPSAGAATVLAATSAAVALGTDSGVVFVVPMRARLGQAVASTLGSPSARDGAATTALALAPQGGLLAAATADGDVTFWEARRGGWELARAVRDAHVDAVVGAAFVGGPPLAPPAAVTLDARGRLVHHPVSSYLSLTAALAGALGRAARPAPLALGGAAAAAVGRPRAVAGLAPPPRSPAAAAADAARGSLPPDAPGLACEGALAVVGDAGALLARLAPGASPRLVPLHAIPLPDGNGPSLFAWALADPTPGAPPAALVAVARGARATTLRAPLARPRPDAGLDPATPIAAWCEAAPVAGLAWLGGGAAGARGLAVLAQAEGAAGTLALRAADVEVEASSAGAPPAAHDTLHLHAPLAPAPPALAGTLPPLAAGASSVAILLRGPGGTPTPAAARVLPAGDRAGALAGAGRWAEALGAALDAVAAATAAGEDVRPAAAAAADAVASYAEAALGSTPPPPPNAAAVATFALAALAAVRAGDAAWYRLAPPFAAAGASPALARAAAAAARARALPRLPPDAVAAIVAVCEADGESGVFALEGLLAGTDPAALDFDAAARAAARAGATAALASLFGRALGDVATPVAVLLARGVTARDAGDAAGWAAAGWRALAVLRAAFAGAAHPPGAGPLPPHLADRARAGGLGFLLHASPDSVAAALAAVGVESAGGLAALRTALPGPHPALRALAGLDAVATVRVLRSGLLGWDALQAELCDAAAAPRPPGAGGRSAAQAAADALAALLDGGHLVGAGAAAGLDLLADLVGAGRAAASAGALRAALERAALGPWPPGAAPPPATREASFLRLFRAARAGGADLDVNAAKALARAAGFARAEAEAHGAAGDAGAALDCLLAADARSAFDYADAALTDAGPAGPARDALRSALLSRAGALAAADAGAAAALVATHFPDDHPAVLAALGGAADLTFSYLKGAYAAAAATVGPPGGASGGGGAALLADAAAGDAYVRLLCRFEPRGVLPFLASRAAYSAAAALKEARRADAADARAFLLERLGDAPGAAALLASRVAVAGRAAFAAAGGGAVPVAERAAVRAALSDALGLCRRAAPDLPPTAGTSLWLTVLDALADVLRDARAAGAGAGARGELAALVDGAVAAAAGCVPLRAVGEHLITRCADDPLAEYGRTLGGVLAAARREGGLLERAADVAAADARRAGAALAAARGRALKPVRIVEGQVGGGLGNAPAAATRATASLATAPARAASLMLAACAGPVLTARDDPDSPLHRGGVDVAFLRAHGDARL